MQKVRTVDNTDKTIISILLKNTNIKNQIKMINNGLRVVFEGDWNLVAIALNENGYLHAGHCKFTKSCFNDTDPKHGEVFVRFNSF